MTRPDFVLMLHSHRWPGGLKPWRATGPDADLGRKQAYDVLAHSSDWQVIISTGTAADCAEQRLHRHCHDAEALLDALVPDAGAEDRAAAVAPAARTDHRDALFPDILGAVDTVLTGG
jgi:hypothetical protein